MALRVLNDRCPFCDAPAWGSLAGDDGELVDCPSCGPLLFPPRARVEAAALPEVRRRAIAGMIQLGRGRRGRRAFEVRAELLR